jgi:hypothetical protein
MKAQGTLLKKPLEEEMRPLIARMLGMMDYAIKADKVNSKKACDDLIAELNASKRDIDLMIRRCRNKQWDLDKAAAYAKRGVGPDQDEAVHNEVDH